MAYVTRLPTDMFRFTAGERSGIYTAALHVFGEANERLETTLGLDDVAERLAQLGWSGIEHAAAILASTGALQTAVLDAIHDRLIDWGALLADPGSSDRRIFTTLQELEGHLKPSAA